MKLAFVRPDPLYEQDDFYKEAERRLGRELVPAEVSRYWLGQGLDFIIKEPVTFLQLTGKKYCCFSTTTKFRRTIIFTFINVIPAFLKICH